MTGEKFRVDAGEKTTKNRLEKIAGKIGKEASVCCLLFFLLLLIYGCFAVNDYGISVDENVERNSSLVTWKYLVPSVADTVTEAVNFQEIQELDSYIDRYYGVAVQLPMVAIEHVFGFQLPIRTVYLIRHFYTFLLFYGAAAVFYFLVRRLTGSQWAAFLGTVMLVLSPRMLAESFYNIKDMVFLSFVIYNLYAGVCFLERPTVKNGVVLAVVSALCTNVRVVGIVVIASCLTVAFLKETVLALAEKMSWKRLAGRYLPLAGVLTVWAAAYILSMPVLWKNPVAELINTVKTFSDFTNWDDIFLYRGFPVRGNNLPRSYLFVWLFISTPVLYLFLFLTGIVERFLTWLRSLRAALGRTGRKERGEAPGVTTENKAASNGERTDGLIPDFWNHIFLGMVLIIPLCYVVLRKPTLYNGWRHFYFLYGVIMVYAAYGLLFLGRKAGFTDGKSFAESRNPDVGESDSRMQAEERSGNKRKKWVKISFGALWAVCMAVTVGWMVKNHPYEYVYFNPLVRHYALESFELDYWAVSEAELFQYICDHDDREEIRLWCTASDYDKSVLMLSEADRSRLIYVDSPVKADYAVCRDLMKNCAEQMERQFAFEELYSVVVDGKTINTVFRRTDDLAARTIVARTPEGLFFEPALSPGHQAGSTDAAAKGDGSGMPGGTDSDNGLDGNGVSDVSDSGTIVWKAEWDGELGQETLTADLGEETDLTVVSVRHEDGTYLEEMSLYLSEDGKKWKEISWTEEDERYILSNRKAVFRCGVPARYLKLARRDGLASGDSGSEVTLEIELYTALRGQGEPVFAGLIERVTGHENSAASVRTVDGSLTTRWQSEDIQKQGIAFDIVLKENHMLSGIRLDTGEYSDEFPRSLRIFATKDETEWIELPVESRDQRLFTFPDTEVKALRLLTGNMDGMDVQSRWSICEIMLMERAER